MKYYKCCPKCGHIEMYSSDNCRKCKTELIETDVEYDFDDWYKRKQEITQQIYEKYQIKENPLYDEKAVKKREESEELARRVSLSPSTKSANKVTCPYCKSTNVSKISTAGRVFSVGLFGLGSSKVGKQWHCNKCKSDF